MKCGLVTGQQQVDGDCPQQAHLVLVGEAQDVHQHADDPDQHQDEAQREECLHGDEECCATKKSSYHNCHAEVTTMLRELFFSSIELLRLERVQLVLTGHEEVPHFRVTGRERVEHPAAAGEVA